MKDMTEKYTISSIEVAEMMEVEHAKLIRKLEGGRDRKGYIQILNEAQMGVADYFVKSSYRDAKGEARPCYQVTKLGCDFLANKFTGEKGVIFTAKYVKRFDEMEHTLKLGLTETARAKSVTIPTRSTTALPRRSDWFSRNRARIKRACEYLEVDHRELYHRILKRLNETFDLKAAEEIYKRERGFEPEYAIDIVGYFPELEKMSDRILDEWDYMNPDR